MTHCPKCGQRLHLYNVSQFCPNCKVNLRFCNFEENFYREAKEAELYLARMHVKLRHMKVAFIGSKLAILRLVVTVFPILALLLSAGNVTLTMPFVQRVFDVNGIGLYNSFSDGTVAYILKMASSNLAAGDFSLLRNILLCYIAVAFVAVVIFFMTLLCFISYKNMPKIIAITAGVGVVLSLVMKFVSDYFYSGLSSSEIITAKSGIGLYIVAVGFLCVVAGNVLLLIFKPKVEYEEGDWERYQILLQVKRGEVDFDSLPQPIFETEETRQIEEEIAKGLKHFEDEAGKKEIEQGEAEPEAEAVVDTQEQ